MCWGNSDPLLLTCVFSVWKRQQSFVHRHLNTRCSRCCKQQNSCPPFATDYCKTSSCCSKYVWLLLDFLIGCPLGKVCGRVWSFFPDKLTCIIIENYPSYKACSPNILACGYEVLQWSGKYPDGKDFFFFFFHSFPLWLKRMKGNKKYNQAVQNLVQVPWLCPVPASYLPSAYLLGQ